tara:strand:+ start:797 stop:1456 length:660 start_codon:yes stop_codon:yes gene_type:complete
MTKALNMNKRKKSYSFAFLGTDGSGKSTIISHITPVLNNVYPDTVYYEHLRPNLFPSIARLLGKKDEFNDPVTNPHSKNPSGTFGSLFRWSYYLLDYTIGYGLKVFPKKIFTSCVWIFDRYYYDYRLDKRRTRVDLPDWVLKFGQWIIPEPDIIFCLGADPEIIFARKPELPLEEVQRQVEKLKLFSIDKKKAIWIDTSDSIEKSVEDVILAINNLTNK